MKLNSSSRLTAESAIDGVDGTGTDSTLAALGITALLGCACLALILAGAAAFILLRRKKTSAAED